MVSRTSPRRATDVIANDVADAVSDGVQADLLNCRRCPRLRHYLKQLRNQYPDYWNRPVAASGPKDAPLQIIGLAPGLVIGLAIGPVLGLVIGPVLGLVIGLVQGLVTCIGINLGQ